MKKTKLTRSLLAACSIVALSAVMYGCTGDGSENDLKATQGDLEEVQAQLDAANARIAELDGMLADATTRADGLQTQLDAANATSAGLQTDLDAANAMVAGLQMDLDAANATAAGLQMDLDAANANVADLQMQLATVTGNADDLQMRLDTAMANAASLQMDLDAANANVADLQMQLATATGNADDLQMRLDTAMANAADLQTQLAQAEADRDMYKQMVDEMTAEDELEERKARGNAVSAAIMLASEATTAVPMPTGTTGITAERLNDGTVTVTAAVAADAEEFTGGEAPAGSGAWTMAMLTRMNDTSEDTIVVYTDVGEPTGTAVSTLLTAGVLTPTAANMKLDSPPEAGASTEYSQDDTFTGTYTQGQTDIPGRTLVVAEPVPLMWPTTERSQLPGR